jgi:hypothetical protein
MIVCFSTMRISPMPAPIQAAIQLWSDTDDEYFKD